MTEKQEQRDRAAFPLGRAFAGGPRPSLQALLASESLRWARWAGGLPQWWRGGSHVMVWQGLGVSSACGSDSCKSPGATGRSVQSGTTRAEGRCWPCPRTAEGGLP